MKQKGVNSLYNFEKVLDLIEEGVIVIDNNGFIKIYNSLARNVFGLSPDLGKGHKSGQIKDGDVVIIVDNLLGGDDGDLEPETLSLIGIDPNEIKKGDALIAIGKKGGRPGTGKMRRLDTDKTSVDILVLREKIGGLNIEGTIDFVNRCLSIKTGSEAFDYFYSWCAGHMVILDPDTLEVKFYQAKGYTARKEEIKKVLKGYRYGSKGKDIKPIKIINRHISELHTCSFIINELLEVAKGKETQVKAMESTLNGIPVRCSIYPIEEKYERQGAMLKILDITELNELRQNTRTGREYQEIEKIQDAAFKDIIYVSSIMKKTIEMAKRISETNSTVLLQGESGTGKGMFAEAVHKASARRNNSFVYINCASIPENLIESELFGHEKGSFTGAYCQKIGKFEIADNGTIFLDEIGEIPYTIQAKLLHVLQNRSFTRVGGLKDINVDVRIISASNKDLKNLVEKGKFREDLFYRLNVFPIVIPPLRERTKDIYHLVRHMLPLLCDKCGKDIEYIPEDFFKALYDYHWPGNIRELENILERAITLTSGKTLFPYSLPDYIFNGDGAEAVGTEKKELVEILRISRMKDILHEAEEKAIEMALEVCNGKKKDAYELLGIGKTSFFNKHKKIRKGSE